MADKRNAKNVVPTDVIPVGFADIVALIEAARVRAAQTVNTVIIDLYWNIGEYLSRLARARGS